MKATYWFCRLFRLLFSWS